MRSFFIEWKRTNETAIGSVLYEGCYLTTALIGETDVYHQLHGDGSRYRRSAVVSALSRTTDQGCISAPEKGTYHNSSDLHPALCFVLCTRDICLYS